MCKGDWIQTYSGGKFWPLDPRPEDVNIIDIAHALSMMCRFGGHTDFFYSVAEHSCHVHDILPIEHRKAGVLHDGSEAYIADIVTPAKRYMPEYQEIEDKIQRAVSERFGLPYPYDPAIKVADRMVLVAESEQVMGPKPQKWEGYPEAADIKCLGMYPLEAENAFLQRCKALGIE